MLRSRIQDLLRSLFSFSRRERKRVLLLLPLLVALCLLFARLGKPRFEKSFTLYSDRVLDSVQANIHTGISDNFAEKVFSSGKSPQSGKSREPRRDSLFTFDPNTATLEQLIRLGFSPKQARVILNTAMPALFSATKRISRAATPSPPRNSQNWPRTYASIRPTLPSSRIRIRFAPATGRKTNRKQTPHPIRTGLRPGRTPLPYRYRQAVIQMLHQRLSGTSETNNPGTQAR